MKRLACSLLAVLAGLGAQVPTVRRPESNRLWSRDPAAVNAPWQPVGRAQRLLAMAAIGGRLYGASVAHYVLERERSLGDAPWTIIGESWMVSAMAALEGKLYVANREGVLGVAPPAPNIYFKAIGEQKGIIAMAGLDGNIYAVNCAGRLLAWQDAVHKPVRWMDIGRADLVTALAALDGKLYAATSNNRLLIRDSTLADRPWKLIGHAENVTAMTAYNGKLYAAAYSPAVIAIPQKPTVCALWETNRLYWEARGFLRAAKQAGKIQGSRECLGLAGDPQALKTRGGRELADLIAGSCAQCACAAEFPAR